MTSKCFVGAFILLLTFLMSCKCNAQLELNNEVSAGVGIDFFSLDYSRYLGKTNRHGIEIGILFNEQRYYDPLGLSENIQSQAKLLYKYTTIRANSFDFNLGAGYITSDGIQSAAIPLMLEAQYWFRDERAGIKVRLTNLIRGSVNYQALPSVGFSFRF